MAKEGKTVAKIKAVLTTYPDGCMSIEVDTKGDICMKQFLINYIARRVAEESGEKPSEVLKKCADFSERKEKRGQW